MADEQQSSVQQLQIIRGCPFPASEFFSRKNIEDAMDHMPEDGDSIIASYPKTGTTWMQYIVLQIVSGGTYFPSFNDTTYKVIPFIEMSGIDAVKALSKPRIYKHHIAYNLVQKNDKAKCIYIYRHPEDTVVSFYHFSRSMGSPINDFDKFFEDFMSGNIGYGKYFQHVLSFYEHCGDPNLLMVSYEKLHANRKEEILRIAKFIGEEYYTNLLENDEILSKIIEHTSFDYMKKNLSLTLPFKKSNDGSESTEERTVTFFRKGIVGDGRNVLTDAQRQRMKSEAQDLLSGTSIVDEWYKE